MQACSFQISSLFFSLLIIENLVCEIITNEVVIKIGHLLPQKQSVMHEPEVLQLCAKDLKERHILPHNISFQ